MAQCALLLALLGTAAAYGADVYRTRAADGTITYSDRPEGDNSEFVVVNTPRTGAAAAAQQRTPQGQRAAGNAPNAAAGPPEAAATPPALEGPSAAELRAQRQKNCDTARERLERFTLSRRLYRTTAAGEREYLSDEQSAEARTKAQADVQDWCG